ncbi:hypothetical protein WG66_010633 [Moniliophthora roreri]|nr:hypothetical protein WG66_010633 [Moniliophthora roreri]
MRFKVDSSATSPMADTLTEHILPVLQQNSTSNGVRSPEVTNCTNEPSRRQSWSTDTTLYDETPRHLYQLGTATQFRAAFRDPDESRVKAWPE